MPRTAERRAVADVAAALAAFLVPGIWLSDLAIPDGPVRGLLALRRAPRWSAGPPAPFCGETPFFHPRGPRHPGQGRLTAVVPP